MQKWYSQSISQILADLETNNETGLLVNDVKSRLEKYGANELKEEKKKSFLSKIIAQFTDFLVLILIGSAIISFAVGKGDDALVIIAIVIVNAFLGIYQEGKAEKALDALKKMSSPTAKVIRNGVMILIRNAS